MQKITFLTAIIILLLTSTAFALRCGSQLVNIGDLKNEVFIACGNPVSRETIGYIDQVKNDDRIRVMKIEEWIIVTDSMYYSLIFEGNKLITIEDAGRIQK